MHQHPKLTLALELLTFLPILLGLGLTLGIQDEGSRSISISALSPPTSLSISVPQPLGSEAFKILFEVRLGLPFIPVGQIGAWKSPKDHHESKLPQSPRKWMDGPISSSLRLSPAHPGPPWSTPLSYFPFSPLQKDMPSPFALHPSPASSFLPGFIPLSPGQDDTLVLLHFGTEFPICLWCVSSC